jgi:hypothetical protein
MTQSLQGHLAKLVAVKPDSGFIEYSLPLDDQLVPLNPLLGRTVKLTYGGVIHCRHCGRVSKKSFNQGHCYPCFRKLASCDSCIMSPEKCHFDQGTCRDPEWGEQFCMTDHFVYLANSSGVKVGITRGSQIPTRWIDQGASQALPIMRVSTRYQSGLAEDAFRKHVADRTNWRAMLKGNAEALDLSVIRDQLFNLCAEDLDSLVGLFGVQAIRPLDDADSVEMDYPVREFPTKVTSFNLDKNPVAEGILMGIKGQYLILDTGVINIRKYTAYQVVFTF